MIFHQIPTGGCQSYVIGCAESCAAASIHAEIRQIDRYQGIVTREGLRIRYVIDTHTTQIISRWRDTRTRSLPFWLAAPAACLLVSLACRAAADV